MLSRDLLKQISVSSWQTCCFTAPSSAVLLPRNVFIHYCINSGACSELAQSLLASPIDLLTCLQGRPPAHIHHLQKDAISHCQLLFLPTTIGQMFLECLWHWSSWCGDGGQCLSSQPLVWRGQSDGEQRFGASLERLASQACIWVSCSFYGQIPYLLVYAAAGVHIQFGRLLPLGQV